MVQKLKRGATREKPAFSGRSFGRDSAPSADCGEVARERQAKSVTKSGGIEP
jgi:hypothetical protein